MTGKFNRILKITVGQHEWFPFADQFRSCGLAPPRSTAGCPRTNFLEWRPRPSGRRRSGHNCGHRLLHRQDKAFDGHEFARRLNEAWFAVAHPRGALEGFVTFMGFTCQYGGALSARMSIQCLRVLVGEPNRLGNRLFLANVTIPPSAFAARGHRTRIGIGQRDPLVGCRLAAGNLSKPAK